MFKPNFLIKVCLLSGILLGSGEAIFGVTLDAGNSHTCMLMKSDNKCWNSNPFGQLRNASKRDKINLNARLSLNEIRKLTISDLENIDVNIFLQQSPEYILYFLTNLNIEKSEYTALEKFISDNLTLDLETGGLKPQVGSKVTLRILAKTKLPAQVKLPELPNLKAGFGVGGVGTSILDGVEEALKASNLGDLIPSQDDKGIMHIKGNGINASVIPNIGNIKIFDRKIKAVGLSLWKGVFMEPIFQMAYNLNLSRFHKIQ